MNGLIPKSLQDNEAFRSDVKASLSLPVETLSDLVKELRSYPAASSEDLHLSTIGGDAEVLESAATFLVYLARRVCRAEGEINPELELRNFAEEIGVATEGWWPVISPLFEKGEPYQREAEAIHAFHLDPGYEGVSFEVLMRPRRPGSDDLVVGFHWTIKYHEQSGDARSLSFVVARSQVEELARVARMALESAGAS